MGFRARRSFKVVPGVRMTVTHRGVGVSAGVPGARASVNSSGRITKSVGIPGTGLSNVTTSRIGSNGYTATRSATASPAPSVPTPGMFAPKADKALHKAITGQPDQATFQHLATTFPALINVVALYELMLLAGPTQDDARATVLLESLVTSNFEPQRDPFYSKYTPHATLGMEIADGIAVTFPPDKNALGLALAELHQKAGNLDRAIAIVEDLEPTSIAAVSLAELYAAQERWPEIIELTDGLSNDDDASTYLLVQRGHAFREQGMHTAAHETLKEALRLRSRSADLRLPALVERGLNYLAEGKKAMARKDFERVLSERSDYAGVAELIALTQA